MPRVFTDEDAIEYLEDHLEDEMEGTWDELIKYYFDMIPPTSLSDYGSTQYVQVANFIQQRKGIDVLSERNILEGGGLYVAESDIMGLASTAKFTIIPTEQDKYLLIQPGCQDAIVIPKSDLVILKQEQKFQPLQHRAQYIAEPEAHLSLVEAVKLLNAKFAKRGIKGQERFFLEVDTLYQQLPNKNRHALTMEDKVIALAEAYDQLDVQESTVQIDYSVLQTGSLILTMRGLEDYFDSNYGGLIYVSDRYHVQAALFELPLEQIGPWRDAIKKVNTVTVGYTKQATGKAAGKLLASVASGARIRNINTETVPRGEKIQKKNTLVTLSNCEVEMLISNGFISIISLENLTKLL